MNKLLKTLFAAIISISLIISVCVSVTAETYYVLDGFTYKVVDYGVSIHAWDYSSDTMTVPQLLGGTRVAEIDDFAFNNDTNITKVKFSEASYLSRIGKMSFLKSGLTGSLELTPSITNIGVGAFQGCANLTEVLYNSQATVIPNQCFKECTELTKVEITSSVESIGAYAFQNCTSLESVVIPKTVTTISPSAFLNDFNLTLGVWYDSYGYQYAVQNNINYTLLDGVKLGDVNGDNIVNVDDATLIQKYLAELETIEGIYLYAADSNEDTEIDVSDATAIQMYSVELQTGHPIGQVMTK